MESVQTNELLMWLREGEITEYNALDNKNNNNGYLLLLLEFAFMDLQYGRIKIMVTCARPLMRFFDPFRVLSIWLPVLGHCFACA